MRPARPAARNIPMPQAPPTGAVNRQTSNVRVTTTAPGPGLGGGARPQAPDAAWSAAGPTDRENDLTATRRRAKHAAPSTFSPLRAASLPCLLLGAAGAAFAGMAALPASAVDAPAARVTAAEALAPVELAPANVQLAAVLEQGRAAADRQAAARLAARASRSRTAPAAAPAAKATAAPKAAVALFVRPGEGRRTSGYGRRWGRLHAGVDLAAGIGSPIRAVAAGVVKSAGQESGYGNCVRVVHADGTETVYAHMSRIVARGGDRVSAGELLGKEGNTGRSTGPHLHFEVRINGTPINPLPWLAQRGIKV